MEPAIVTRFREPFSLRLEAIYTIGADDSVAHGLTVSSRRPGEPDQIILVMGELGRPEGAEQSGEAIRQYAQEYLVPFGERFFVLAARAGRTALSFREEEYGFPGFRARLLVDMTCAPAYEHPTGVDLWLEELPYHPESDRRILLHLAADEERHARRAYAPALRPEMVDGEGRRVAGGAFSDDQTWHEARAQVAERHCAALIELLTSLPERG